jgi:ArsR family transcriptional regulator
MTATLVRSTRRDLQHDHAFTARTARLFHALSDVTRLGIVEQLKDGERCVCELMDTLGAAQSRLSFHLKVLKDAELVTDRQEGRWSYYELRCETLNEIAKVVQVLTPDGRSQR